MKRKAEQNNQIYTDIYKKDVDLKKKYFLNLLPFEMTFMIILFA